MSAYSEATTKKYNRVLLAGSSLVIVQAYQLKITNIPLIGLEKLNPFVTKGLLASIVIVTIISFGFSFILNDFDKGFKKKFFIPILRSFRNVHPYPGDYLDVFPDMHNQTPRFFDYVRAFFPLAKDSRPQFSKYIATVTVYVFFRAVHFIQTLSVGIIWVVALSTLFNYWPSWLIFTTIDELPFCMNPSPIRLWVNPH